MGVHALPAATRAQHNRRALASSELAIAIAVWDLQEQSLTSSHIEGEDPQVLPLRRATVSLTPGVK